MLINKAPFNLIYLCVSVHVGDRQDHARHVSVGEMYLRAPVNSSGTRRVVFILGGVHVLLAGTSFTYGT